VVSRVSYRQVLVVLAAIFVVGPPFYFAITCAGPYQWLAELQLYFFNSYSSMWTFLGTMLGWILFAMALIGVGAAVVQRVTGITAFREPEQDAQLLEQLFRTARGAQLLEQLFRTAMVAGPLIGCAAGIYMWGSAQSMGGPVAVPLTQVTEGSLPSRYVTLTGARPLPGQACAITEERRSSSNTEYFIPLVPAGWQQGDPVLAVTQLSEFRERLVELERDLARIQPNGSTDPPERQNQFTGLIGRTGLPWLAKREFAAKGIRLADGYVVLHQGKTPSDAAVEGLVIIGISVFIGLILGWRLLMPAKVRKRHEGMLRALDAEGEHSPAEKVLQTYLPPAVGWAIFLGLLVVAVGVLVWVATRE
jgi:hypothetical protein